MGTFINIGNEGFARARRREYVDKSMLIDVMNGTLNTEHSFSCVTRCRRFGKSMAAKMLCAYYDKSCDSRALFADLQIAKTPMFETYLNKIPVIYLDMTAFALHYKDPDVVQLIETRLKEDIMGAYNDIVVRDTDSLMECLRKIADERGEHFLFIIDEWDAICRENEGGSPIIDEYVNWLRAMFKDVNAGNVFAGVYMTGILPIKKYNTQSALNNFWEYSMLSPRNMSQYFGFTQVEVRELAEKTGNDFEELVKWYDGYQIGDQMSMFNPNSVIQAVYSHWCESYWASTGAYDAVAEYISMNMDGLKDSIIFLLSGGRVKVNVTTFSNDMKMVRSRDDVLTVLLHLGYLSYDRVRQECYVPNREVSGELENAVEAVKWDGVKRALDASEQLLDATLRGDAEAVAKGIDAAHDEHTSILSYNDENSLACVLSLAYYYAKNNYVFHRELPTGKGFADLVLIPRKNVDSPALVLELKYDKDAVSAIDQIKQKQYPNKVADYTNNMMLVGINYNRKTKTHDCFIEQYKQG